MATFSDDVPPPDLHSPRPRIFNFSRTTVPSGLDLEALNMKHENGRTERHLTVLLRGLVS